MSFRAAVALVAFVGGCGGDALPTGPGTGVVNVVVNGSGDDLDADGVELILDGVQGVIIPVPGTSSGLRPAVGMHTIELRRVAANCDVRAPNPRQVTVEPGGPVTIVFDIDCVRTGIAVSTRTAGIDVPVQFRLSVNGFSTFTVPSNGAYRVGRLSAGSYTLALATPEHCTLASPGPIVVTVAAKGVTAVSIDVTCTSVVRRERIAYEEFDDFDDLPGIVLVNLDGSQREWLRYGSTASWSRDGTRILFADVACFIYDAMCENGIASLDPELATWRSVLSGTLFYPAESPTRNEIAFSTADGIAQIRILDVAAGRVTTMPLPDQRSGYAPSWSPDGERLAFTCFLPRGKSELCAIDRDGTDFQRITIDTVPESGPAWSPDGRTIAFTRYPDAASAIPQIVLLDLATQRRTVIATGSDPAWSPDGARMVYAGSDGIFVMNADGSGRRRLTTGYDRAPVWRPSR